LEAGEAVGKVAYGRQDGPDGGDAPDALAEGEKPED
jgi:hypothetical protein